jgi:16S rRNA (adenine(1408)-N(1))-methyltransferase
VAPCSSVVFDIGTGDGRFVASYARKHPEKFVIGIDANAKPLEKLSMKATRKPAKGGLPNAMFVQTAVEALPDEFACLADEIHINFPWGSLLRAVAVGDAEVLAGLRRIACCGAWLEVVIGVDAERDRAELERLGVLVPSLESIEWELLPRYKAAGFKMIDWRELAPAEWARFDTSWARKLSGNESRRVFVMRFRAT